MPNIFTPIRKVIKLDYYGQPYEAFVTGKKENYSELKKGFVKMSGENEEWKVANGSYRGGGSFKSKVTELQAEVISQVL
jgi:hypothetical protein